MLTTNFNANEIFTPSLFYHRWKLYFNSNEPIQNSCALVKRQVFAAFLELLFTAPATIRVTIRMNKIAVLRYQDQGSLVSTTNHAPGDYALVNLTATLDGLSTNTANRKGSVTRNVYPPLPGQFTTQFIPRKHRPSYFRTRSGNP